MREWNELPGGGPTVDDRGRDFFKMCGSGNDFVFFDARFDPASPLDDPDTVRALCARGTGIGADGVVFLERSAVAAVRIRYFNSDGSRASLCGNATLCATRLAVELGAGDRGGFGLETDVGVLQVRMGETTPEIDFAPVRDVAPRAPVGSRANERRVGFAVAGVPHVVVQVDDVDVVELVERGRELRYDRAFPEGANVNFVSPTGDGRWHMRTYERGVEGETLACGTGAVASATLLSTWSGSTGPTTVVTRSGRPLIVRPPDTDRGGPSLAGEGRIVFLGRLREFR